MRHQGPVFPAWKNSCGTWQVKELHDVWKVSVCTPAWQPCGAPTAGSICRLLFPLLRQTYVAAVCSGSSSERNPRLRFKFKRRAATIDTTPPPLSLLTNCLSVRYSLISLVVVHRKCRRQLSAFPPLLSALVQHVTYFPGHLHHHTTKQLATKGGGREPKGTFSSSSIQLHPSGGRGGG
jgi:hypothetical protein